MKISLMETKTFSARHLELILAQNISSLSIFVSLRNMLDLSSRHPKSQILNPKRPFLLKPGKTFRAFYFTNGSAIVDNGDSQNPSPRNVRQIFGDTLVTLSPKPFKT